MNKGLVDAFSGFHPINNFMFYTCILLFTMFFMHPVLLTISFVASLSYAIYLKGLSAVKFNLFFSLPMLILAVLMNPLFNHQGVTILTYLPSGNPLTLESIVYGFTSTMMIVSVMNWFMSYNEIMTSDKFIYLFGKIIPALSLVLSMTLRFIPKFKHHIIDVSSSQKALYGEETSLGFWNKMKHALTVFSIVVTWSLENSIETSDSMRSRGYGLEGRTAYSIYRFDSRDKVTLSWFIFSSFYVLSGYLSTSIFFRYYPSIKSAGMNQFTLSFYVIYFCLAFSPLIINVYEDYKWKKINQ